MIDINAVREVVQTTMIKAEDQQIRHTLRRTRELLQDTERVYNRSDTGLLFTLASVVEAETNLQEVRKYVIKAIKHWADSALKEAQEEAKDAN